MLEHDRNRLLAIIITHTFDKLSRMTNTVRTPKSFSLRIATSTACRYDIYVDIVVVDFYICVLVNILLSYTYVLLQ